MPGTPPKSAEPFLLKRRDLDIEQYNREPWRQASWTFPSVMLSGEDWPRVRQFALDTYMQMRQLYPEQFKNKTVMDWETALVNFFTTRRPDFRAQVLGQLKSRYGEGKPMDPDLVLAKAVEGFGKSAAVNTVLINEAGRLLKKIKYDPEAIDKLWSTYPKEKNLFSVEGPFDPADPHADADRYNLFKGKVIEGSGRPAIKFEATLDDKIHSRIGGAYKRLVGQGHSIEKSIETASPEKGMWTTYFVLRKPTELGKSGASSIQFPEDERKALIERLEAGKNIFTSRMSAEKGKYQEGARLTSPLGALVVKRVQPLEKVEQHPFLSELTGGQKKQLAGHPFDLVELRKSASGSQVKKFVEENLKKDLDFVMTMEKKGYLVVEKSLPASKVKEIRSGQFGPFSIEEKDKDWGDFFRMRVPPDREAAFIKFLKDNLKGKGWYADSMGTTNKVVFPGRVFTVNSAEESTKAKAFGRGLGIPTGQLDFDKDLKKKASDIFMDEVLKCAGGPVQRTVERGTVAAMGTDPAAAKGATPRKLGYAPFPGAKR